MPTCYQNQRRQFTGFRLDFVGSVEREHSNRELGTAQFAPFILSAETSPGKDGFVFPAWLKGSFNLISGDKPIETSIRRSTLGGVLTQTISAKLEILREQGRQSVAHTANAMSYCAGVLGWAEAPCSSFSFSSTAAASSILHAFFSTSAYSVSSFTVPGVDPRP